MIGNIDNYGYCKVFRVSSLTGEKNMTISQLEVEPFEKCPSWGGSHDKWQEILAAEAMGNTTENRQKRHDLNIKN